VRGQHPRPVDPPRHRAHSPQENRHGRWFRQHHASGQAHAGPDQVAAGPARAADFEGSAGGGLVKVVVDGRQKVKKLTITPEAINPEDLDELSDLSITAALNMALSASLEHSQAEMKKITGGINLPGLG
jgi:DNA-binding YbaB/EbfC family protein